MKMRKKYPLHSKRLRRITETNKIEIAGVCAGIAYHLGKPVWSVRAIYFLLSVLAGVGTGVLLYIVLWAFMPTWNETPEDFDEVTGD